jgi:hypothetical protein
VQRRLKTAEIEELVASYQAGGKIKDLAARYKSNRNTVMRHIDRAEYVVTTPLSYPRRSGRPLSSTGRDGRW